MNIVIVGDGKVGYTLAEMLSREPHDVTIVDRDVRALRRAESTLDVMCVRGNGANVRTLIEAGVEDADVLIAATTGDEVNMVCCLMGKKLGCRYTVARIRDPEYTDSLQMLQKELGIDMIINPERAAAYEISQLFRYSFAAGIETFAHGRVELVEFRVEDGDKIAGVPLFKMQRPLPRVLYCAVQRGDTAYIPDGEFVLLPGDRVHVAGDLRGLTHFFKRLGRNTQRVKSAILVGGGHISYYLAGIIEDMGVRLRIVEINKDKCDRLSESLQHVEIIHGDGTEKELLESENVTEADALVCLTDRDEENLVTGMLGVRMGVPKVVVKINRLNYLDLIGDMNVGSVISPKKITAQNILRQVRALGMSQGLAAEHIYRIMNDQAEAQEFIAPPKAHYLGTPLSELNIKKGVLVAVLVRGKKVIVPFGSDRIGPGDTMVLIAKTGEVMNLDDVFLP